MLKFNAYCEVLGRTFGTFKWQLDHKDSDLINKLIHSWINGLLDYQESKFLIKVSLALSYMHTLLVRDALCHFRHNHYIY